jgi:hypothetical protein
VLIVRLHFFPRDLGEYLRNQLKATLGDSNIISVNDTKIDKQFAALERLANDAHLKKYQRKLASSATGLTGEQCNQVLSSEFLEYLNEDTKSKR